MNTVDFMKVGTTLLSNGQLPVKRQPCEGVFAGHTLASRNRSVNAFSPCRFLSVARGHHATILQPLPIHAGLPSAAAWSHPTAEGDPSTAEFARKQAVQRKDAKEQIRQAGRFFGTSCLLVFALSSELYHSYTLPMLAAGQSMTKANGASQSAPPWLKMERDTPNWQQSA